MVNNLPWKCEKSHRNCKQSIFGLFTWLTAFAPGKLNRIWLGQNAYGIWFKDQFPFFAD